VTLRISINGQNYTTKWRPFESRWTARAYLGESSQSEFIIDDDDGTIQHSDLAARKIVEVWENATGVDICMYRGRIANKSLGRGAQIVGDAMRWTVITEDSNIDARGIRVDDSTRPEESDRERVLAYLAGYLNGASSTNPNARDSTDIDGTYVIASNLITLPAETYTDTFPAEIFSRIGEVSAKTWFVYVSNDGSMDMYYADHSDVTLASDIEITDNELDADQVDIYNPYLGSSTGEHDGQALISGGSLRYGSDDFYEYSDPGSEADHDKWEEHFTDEYVINQGSAEAFLENIVRSRNNEEFRYITTIDMLATQVHRIKAGMSVPIRLASADKPISGEQRAVQVTYEPITNLVYRVTIEFGVPRGRPFRRNIRPKPGPFPPNPGEPGTAPVVEASAGAIGDLGGSNNMTLDIPTDEAGATVYAVVVDTGGGTISADWQHNLADPGTREAMTLIDSETVGSVRMTWFRRLNPTPRSAATSVVRVADTASQERFTACWYLTGVDQSDPDDTVVFSNGVGTASAITATAASSDMVLNAAGQFANNQSNIIDPAGAGGQTIDFADSSDRPFGQPDGEGGAGHGSSVPTWTWGGVRTWLAGAIAVNASDPGTEGDTTEPVGGTGSGGTGSSNVYAPIDHSHDHSNITTGGPYHEAADVTFAPSGDLTSTDVQSAIEEIAAGVLGDYLTAADGEGHTVNTVAASGTTETLDLASGNLHDVTLTANCTFTFAGATAGVGCYLTLILRQDATGSRTVTWPAEVEWPGGVAPTLSDGANEVDVLSFLSNDGGTTWFGLMAGSGGGIIDSDDVRDAGRWEVIVSGTAPPVAVTNEAEDDWLYGWVST
jgi:hypothetical protein